ncbi:MAG: ferrous iron transport protein A [Clostridiales bacterium]|nr:ferrous iron transport protein A [Clostridiales bacterium]
MTLDMLRCGESAYITAVSDSLELCGRLADIGLTAGSTVKCLYISPEGGTMAFLITGSVFALRKSDCKMITAEKT